MPEQSTAAKEHAITQDLSALPATQLQEPSVPLPDAEFAVALRGYDREAVDAYVTRASQLIAELQARRTPEGAVRRALERVGEEVAGILGRAHETAEQITTESRREADERLRQATREAHQITADARASLRDLDTDTDRIWAERHRIIDDTRTLAHELVQLADAAAERFPAVDDTETEDVEDTETEDAETDEATDEAIAEQAAAKPAAEDDGDAGDAEREASGPRTPARS